MMSPCDVIDHDKPLEPNTEGVVFATIVHVALRYTQEHQQNVKLVDWKLWCIDPLVISIKMTMELINYYYHHYFPGIIMLGLTLLLFYNSYIVL